MGAGEGVPDEGCEEADLLGRGNVSWGGMGEMREDEGM